MQKREGAVVVLAKGGQGGRAITAGLGKSFLCGTGREPRALALPGVMATTVCSLFSFWSRAKGTSLLFPWGLPNPGLQEHASYQELQIQLSPQVSSPTQLRGAGLPCQPCAWAFLCSPAPTHPCNCQQPAPAPSPCLALPPAWSRLLLSPGQACETVRSLLPGELLTNWCIPTCACPMFPYSSWGHFSCPSAKGSYRPCRGQPLHTFKTLFMDG